MTATGFIFPFGRTLLPFSYCFDRECSNTHISFCFLSPSRPDRDRFLRLSQHLLLLSSGLDAVMKAQYEPDR